MHSGGEDAAVRLASAVSRLARGISARHAPGLSASEMAVLADLDGGALTPGQLASLERVRPPSMSRHVKLLHARGLVELTADNSDARRTVVSLTDTGRGALFAARQSSWLAARIAELPGERRDALLGAIGVLEELS
jgi:DNA-binding MarR family transcriptional regulator